MAAEEASERGAALYEAGDFEGALEQFTTSIELVPDFWGSYAQRGITFATLEEHKKALADFEIYLDLVPDGPNLNIYMHMSSSYEALGDIDGAIQILGEAIEEFPNAGRPLMARAVFKAMQENYSGAIEDMEAAIEFDDIEAEIILQGRQLMQTWKEEIGEVPTADEEHEADLELASNLINGGNYSEAIGILNTILDAKEVPDAYSYRGFAYLRIGYYELAVQDYLVFLEYDDTNPEVFTNLALALAALGQAEASVAAIDQAIEMDPNGLRFYIRAIQRIELEDLGGARQDLETALELGLPESFQESAEERLSALEFITVD